MQRDSSGDAGRDGHLLRQRGPQLTDDALVLHATTPFPTQTLPNAMGLGEGLFDAAPNSRNHNRLPWARRPAVAGEIKGGEFGGFRVAAPPPPADRSLRVGGRRRFKCV